MAVILGFRFSVGHIVILNRFLFDRTASSAYDQAD